MFCLLCRWGNEMGEVGEGTTVAVWYAFHPTSPVSSCKPSNTSSADRV